MSQSVIRQSVRFGESAARPLLFLGGMLQPDQHFPPFVEALNRLGYEYHTVRYRGHCISPDPFTLDDVIEDVATVLEGFSEPVVLVGEALGGTIALALCEQVPSRVRCCCVNGVPVWADRQTRSKFSHFARLIQANQMEALGEQAIGDILDSGWVIQHPEWAEHYKTHLIKAASKYSLRKIHFEAIQTPVLVIAALHDTLIPPRHAHELCRRLPQAKLVEMVCGHGVSIEQAEALAALITEFDLATAQCVESAPLPDYSICSV
jgi:pimeloyl-ACP methyl ester carboxylesterase